MRSEGWIDWEIHFTIPYSFWWSTDTFCLHATNCDCDKILNQTLVSFITIVFDAIWQETMQNVFCDYTHQEICLSCQRQQMSSSFCHSPPCFSLIKFHTTIICKKNYIKIADFEKTRLYCFSINSRSPPSTGLRMIFYENCGRGEGKMKRQCHGFRKHVREQAQGES